MKFSLTVAMAASIFAASAAYGTDVNPGLVKASDGAVYGTAGDSKGGTLFKVNADGSSFARIHDFSDPSLGTMPLAGIVEGDDGALYGTTSRGGDLSCLPPGGCGVIFRVNKDGSDYRVLHRFEAYPDGRYPNAAIVADGNLLYGRVETGGDAAKDCACGAIYQVHLDGSGYKLVHYYNFDTGEGVANLALGDRVVFQLTAH